MELSNSSSARIKELGAAADAAAADAEAARKLADSRMPPEQVGGGRARGGGGMVRGGRWDAWRPAEGGGRVLGMGTESRTLGARVGRWFT